MTAQFMPAVEESRRSRVSFSSDGLRIAGHFYAARGETAGGRAPAVAMAGPMTSVKEETLPHYAARLQDSGISVLTFDNRNFGASDAPRPQHLDTGEQVEDLKSAVSYLLTRGDVDPGRVGLCCVCLGAGYGLEVAAFDRRVKAAALIAGGYNISDTYLGLLGADGLAEYLQGLTTHVSASLRPVRSSGSTRSPARRTTGRHRCRCRRRTSTTRARTTARRRSGRTV